MEDKDPGGAGGGHVPRRPIGGVRFSFFVSAGSLRGSRIGFRWRSSPAASSGQLRILRSKSDQSSQSSLSSGGSSESSGDRSTAADPETDPSTSESQSHSTELAMYEDILAAVGEAGG